MVIDQHGIRRKPAGTPEGGQFDYKPQSTHTDMDLTPPNTYPVRHPVDQALYDQGLRIIPTNPGETANVNDCLVYRQPRQGWQAVRRCVYTPLPNGRGRLVCQQYRKLKLRELLNFQGQTAGEIMASILTLPLDVGNTSENHMWISENTIEGDATTIAHTASDWCDHGPGPQAFQLQ